MKKKAAALWLVTLIGSLIYALIGLCLRSEMARDITLYSIIGGVVIVCTIAALETLDII